MGKGDRKKREPNGRLSRKKEDVEARREEAVKQAFEDGPMQTVLKARRNMRADFKEPSDPAKYHKDHSKPVTKLQADRQKLRNRGSVLGNLWADGKITDEQRAAGLDYCDRYIRYSALNGLPRISAAASAYGAIRGASRPDRLKAAAAAKSAHFEDQRVLGQCTAGTGWAMRRACITDENAPLHLVKEGLQALIDAGR